MFDLFRIDTSLGRSSALIATAAVAAMVPTAARCPVAGNSLPLLVTHHHNPPLVLSSSPSKAIYNSQERHPGIIEVTVLVEKSNLANQALPVLQSIGSVLHLFDVASLPLAKFHESDEDGSITVSWYLPDRRLSLIFEQESEDSGWNFVSSRDAGSILAVGSFTGFNPKKVLSLMLY